MFPNDDEPYPEEDNSNLVKILRAAITAYLEAEDREELLPVVEVWG